MRRDDPHVISFLIKSVEKIRVTVLLREPLQVHCAELDG